LAGIAYWIRNAGLALIAATFTLLILAPLLRLTSWRIAARNLLAWGVGALIVITPLLLRNLAIFGTAQPYGQGPSWMGMGPVKSVRLYLWSLLVDATGLHSVAQILAWDAVIFLFIGGPLIALATWGLVQAYRGADANNRYSLVALALYLMAGSAMVIIGRAKYDWVETSLVRYVMQYTWIAVALIFVALATLPGDRLLRNLSGALFVVLLAGHLMYFVGIYDRDRTISQIIAANRGNLPKTAAQTPRIWVLRGPLRKLLSRDDALLDSVRSLPKDAVVMSNVASFLYLTSGRPVRNIEEDEPQAFTCVHHLFRAVGRPVYVVLLPTNSAYDYPQLSPMLR